MRAAATALVGRFGSPDFAGLAANTLSFGVVEPTLIAPVALRSTFIDAAQTNTKNFTTTAASGDWAVLVAVLTRFTGGDGVRQAISATLNGVPMSVLAEANSANLQIEYFWAPAADVPSGTSTVGLSNATANFNGVSVATLEMVEAANDQTGAVVTVVGTSETATSRTAAITTLNNSSCDLAGACSQGAITNITGEQYTFLDGTVQGGNSFTWPALVGVSQEFDGVESFKFTQATATQMLAVAIEMR